MNYVNVVIVINSGQRGSWQEGLTCSERMRIAIETGTAIRYMHEECPRGPVAHGNIRPCNIYLGQELEPHVKKGSHFHKFRLVHETTRGPFLGLYLMFLFPFVFLQDF